LQGIWEVLKRGWRAYSRFMHKVGTVWARIILTILYAILVLPFGVLARLFADPLRIKKRPTHWLEHPEEAMDMSWARRQ